MSPGCCAALEPGQRPCHRIGISEFKLRIIFKNLQWLPAFPCEQGLIQRNGGYRTECNMAVVLTIDDHFSGLSNIAGSGSRGEGHITRSPALTYGHRAWCHDLRLWPLSPVNTRRNSSIAVGMRRARRQVAGDSQR